MTGRRRPLPGQRPPPPPPYRGAPCRLAHPPLTRLFPARSGRAGRGQSPPPSPPPPLAAPPARRCPALPCLLFPFPAQEGQASRPCDPAARQGRGGTRWDGRQGSRELPGAGAAWSGGGSSCCSTCCACWLVRAAGTWVWGDSFPGRALPGSVCRALGWWPASPPPVGGPLEVGELGEGHSAPSQPQFPPPATGSRVGRERRRGWQPRPW